MKPGRTGAPWAFLTIIPVKVQKMNAHVRQGCRASQLTGFFGILAVASEVADSEKGGIRLKLEKRFSSDPAHVLDQVDAPTRYRSRSSSIADRHRDRNIARRSGIRSLSI